MRSSPEENQNAERRLRFRTFAEAAAEEIQDLVISGEFPPGSPLRITALAERLGMSPMPVREALRRLASMGLVELQPHKGAIVRRVSLADLQDTISVRLMLERKAIEMAAERFDDAMATQAQTALETYEGLIRGGSTIEIREAHAEFHFALYRASGSRWLMHAIDPVWRNSERYRFRFTTATDDQDELLIEEHAQLLKACRANDIAWAGQALEDHLRKTTRIMEENVRALELELAGEADTVTTVE